MRENKKIIHVLVVASLLFLSLLTYLLYFNMFRADEVSANPYNRRQWEDEKFVKRGSIYDCNGVVLAESVIEGDNQVRKYPKGRLYSHIIGYHSKVYGKSLLEMTQNDALIGKGDMSISLNEMRSGYDLRLTIDNDLQSYAYNQLKGYKGAIVALEPSTGKVLAMVSLPDFEPDATTLENDWRSIVEREDSPLLARATQGLYPPGSTYKIVTAAAAYRDGRISQTFDDPGFFEMDGTKVENYGKTVHGAIDLRRAFEVSSNYVFCQLGYEMGKDKVLAEAENFGINKQIDFDIPTSKSVIQYKRMNDLDGALVSIGQGQLLMTPLHVAMMGSTIANSGRMMKPYIVDKVTTSSGITLSTTRPQEMFDSIGSSCADYVKTLMEGVVTSGTGRSTQISGITVAGKTGTAENETDKDHAWYVGFAPAENPKICVAVVLEYDNTAGGTTAGPIARNVMAKYLK